MSPLVVVSGALLTVNGALAGHEACCCGGPCCQYKLNLNYSVTYNGPEGTKTATGVGPFIYTYISDNDLMYVIFNCTGAYDCNSAFLGNKLVVAVIIDGEFPGYDGYVEAQQPSGGNPNGGVPCNQQQSMDGLSFNLINCPTLNTATLSVSEI
jgi:hypothetical protein